MSQKDPFWTTFGIYGAVGIQVALAVIGGWLLGNYADQRLKTSPWIALIGLILGFAGGLYNLIRTMKWRQKSGK